METKRRVVEMRFVCLALFSSCLPLYWRDGGWSRMKMVASYKQVLIGPSGWDESEKR